MKKLRLAGRLFSSTRKELVLFVSHNQTIDRNSRHRCRKQMGKIVVSILINFEILITIVRCHGLIMQMVLGYIHSVGVI